MTTLRTKITPTVPTIPFLEEDATDPSKVKTFRTETVVLLQDLHRSVNLDLNDLQADIAAALVTAAADVDADVVTHAALTTGVHGVGGSTVAKITDVSDHSALTTGVHGVGAGTIAKVTDVSDHSALTTGVHGVGASTVAKLSDIGTTVLDSAVASTTVGNTTDETTLYTFSIPANTLGTANALRLTLIGTILQNAAKTLTLRLKYDDTVIATAVVVSSDSATTFPLKINAYLVAQGATNSQWGCVDAIFPMYGSAQGTAAEDSTGTLNLLVTAQWSGAHASATLTSKYAILEKITGV